MCMLMYKHVRAKLQKAKYDDGIGERMTRIHKPSIAQRLVKAVKPCTVSVKACAFKAKPRRPRARAMQGAVYPINGLENCQSVQQKSRKERTALLMISRNFLLGRKILRAFQRNQEGSLKCFVSVPSPLSRHFPVFHEDF